jgi:hypothetical protein
MSDQGEVEISDSVFFDLGDLKSGEELGSITVREVRWTDIHAKRGATISNCYIAGGGAPKITISVAAGRVHHVAIQNCALLPIEIGEKYYARAMRRIRIKAFLMRPVHWWRRVTRRRAT